MILGKVENNREQFDKILLPKICLNRYFTAEGVRTYNIETWKLINGEKGK